MYELGQRVKVKPSSNEWERMHNGVEGVVIKRDFVHLGTLYTVRLDNGAYYIGFEGEIEPV